MFKPFHRDQDYLLPPSLQELIPDGDLVYVVAEAVNLLDLNPIYGRYHRLGQNAYHPGMLLSILFYAYARGTFSSRRIADQLQENVRFMYLSGMQRPDFRTVSDFRKDNIDLLKDYFAQIVQICQSAGMIPMHAVAIDGSRIKASASSSRTVPYDVLTSQLEATEAEIERLFEAAEAADRSEDDSSDNDPPAGHQSPKLSTVRDKLRTAKNTLEANRKLKRINTTDPYCRLQKKVGPGYNAQIAVDCDSQIVLSARVVSEENDQHQLIPMIESTERNTRSVRQPKKVYADSGYASAAVFKILESNPHIDGYVPTREQTGKQRQGISEFDKSKFNYNLETETCICPEGHSLRILRRGTNKSGERYINFIGTACPSCPSRSQCTKAKYRNLVVLRADHALRRMEAKMDSAAGHQAMRLRKQTAEPVFGTLKEHMGFRSFRLRGLHKVNGEFALLCAAFNLKKLHKWLNGRPLGVRLADFQRAIELVTYKILKLISPRRLWSVR